MRLSAFLPLGLFAALALIFVFAIFGGDPSKVPSALEGKLVPSFSLPAIEGLAAVDGLEVAGFGDGDLKQGQVTLVNVWGSWCVPCRQEHPILMALAERTDITLFGLNYKDAPDAAARFLAEEGNPFARIGADRTGRVGIDWGVYGVPETFVVDGAGRIVYKHIGPLTPELVESRLAPAIAQAHQSN